MMGVQDMLENNPEKLAELGANENVTEVLCDSNKLRQYITVSSEVPLQDILDLACQLSIDDIANQAMGEQFFSSWMSQEAWQVSPFRFCHHVFLRKGMHF